MSEQAAEPLAGEIQLLRHMLATIAYRGGKALRGAAPGFAQFQIAPASRNPGQILAHIGDLLDWAVCFLDGRHEWHDSEPLAWEQGSARFFRLLQEVDKRLASSDRLQCPAGKLFQGPIADILTHIGQISMLRRLASCPVKGENYFAAPISVGLVGPEQGPAAVEFD